MKKYSASIFAAACVAAASAAHALPRPSDKLSLELFAGGNVAMPGSMRGQATPFQPVEGGSLVYDDLKFDDAYRHRIGGGAELAYAFDPHFAAFARASYNEFNGDRVNIGEIDVPASALTSTRVIAANFGDTATREYDLGARYTFAPWGKLSPFVGAALGATHLSGTKAAVDNLSGVGTTDVELGKRATVFSQRAELGLQYSPVRDFDLRLTAAANHVDGERRSGDPNLALLGLDNANGDVRDHWGYPVELGGVWHF
jgi:hypothetical protein